jgi:parallel beta helix pectate lyase-like protein/putative metal-binding protein
MDASVHPGAEEVCGDGVDNDCFGGDEACGECAVTVPTGAPTINAGLAQAQPGDRVCVLAGTYAEQVVLPAYAIELVAVDGPALTAIEGDGTKPVVVISGGSGMVVSGFTVRYGKWEQDTADAGGIRVENASPTLENLIVEDNQGSGITCEASTVSITGSIIRNNVDAWYGGGVQVWLAATVTVDRTEVYGNDAARGGAIYVTNGSSVTASHGIYHDNYGAYGGAVYVESLGSTATLSNLLLHSNDSGYGGAICLGNGAITLSHVAMIGNGGGYASAVFQDDQSTLLGDHVIVAGGQNDSAIYVEESSTMTLTHALIHRNALGSLRMNLGGTVLLDDSIVSYNGGISCWNQPCTVDGGGLSALWSDGIGQGVQANGFVSLYPELVESLNPDPLLWDLHLAVGSAAIDAADPAATDPDGSPADLGAYGGPGADGWDIDGDGYPSWWQPGPYDAVTYPALGLDCDDRDASVHPGSGC